MTRISYSCALRCRLKKARGQILDIEASRALHSDRYDILYRTRIAKAQDPGKHMMFSRFPVHDFACFICPRTASNIAKVWVHHCTSDPPRQPKPQSSIALLRNSSRTRNAQIQFCTNHVKRRAIQVSLAKRCFRRYMHKACYRMRSAHYVGPSEEDYSFLISFDIREPFDTTRRRNKLIGSYNRAFVRKGINSLRSIAHRGGSPKSGFLIT